jgi:tetratricopeptide (TPR) repeat protein
MARERAASVTPASAQIESGEVLDLLTSLVQKSLVLYEEDGRGQGRYRLLEPMRQYARDRLLEAGEGESVRGRHLAFFLALAEEAEPLLQGPRQVEWLDRLEQELENLRAALEWSEGTEGGAEGILRLVTATGVFWDCRFRRREGAHWLRRALQDTSGKPTPLRAKALFSASVLFGRGGSSGDDPLALLKESVATYRQLGDKQGLIGPLAELARVTRGDSEAALALHEESVTLAREVGDTDRLAGALWAMSFTLMDRRDWVRLEEVLQEALQLQRERGSPMGLSVCFRQLGRAAMHQGEYAVAKPLFLEALARARLVKEVDGVAIELANLAEVAIREGDYAQARELCGERLTLARTTEMKWHLAHALDRLAVIEAGRNQPARAGRIFGALQAWQEATGARLDNEPWTYVYPRGASIAAARAALGETLFEASWAEGRAMSLEEAVAYALAEEDAP